MSYHIQQYCISIIDNFDNFTQDVLERWQESINSNLLWAKMVAIKKFVIKNNLSKLSPIMLITGDV